MNLSTSGIGFAAVLKSSVPVSEAYADPAYQNAPYREGTYYKYRKTQSSFF